jgi:uncharacterized protein GlcG (DUF336 family)
MAKQVCGSRWEEDNRALDKYISLQIVNTEDMEDIVSKFSDALMAACDKSFKKARTPTKTQKGTLVDRRLNSSKEVGKCIQKEIPKNKKQYHYT